MIVQRNKGFSLFLIRVGDIQGVPVFSKRFPIVLPAHIVFLEPAVCFELAAGQNDIYILDWVIDTPNVLNDLRSGTFQEIFKVNLVEHSLDVGQANLERGMTMPATVCLVHGLCIFL